MNKVRGLQFFFIFSVLIFIVLLFKYIDLEAIYRRSARPQGGIAIIKVARGPDYNDTSICFPRKISPSNSSCLDFMFETSYDQKQFKNTFKRKVILSTDTQQIFYAWYAPITSLIWYSMGWTPVVIFADTASSSPGPVFEFIMKNVELAGGEVIRLKSKKYYSPSTVAQISRFGVCVADWPEDTYVMTSDIDMWPLNKTFFDQQTSFPSAIDLLYADVHLYPVCYIGMNVSMWRRVIGFKKGDSITSVVKGIQKEFSRSLLIMTSPAQWHADQIIVTKRIKKWSGYPKDIHFYTKRFSFSNMTDRLDRAPLPNKDVMPPEYIDSHVLRPGFIKEHWSHLRDIANHLLNDEQMKFIDKYAEDFCYLTYCTKTSVSESIKPLYHL